MKIFLSSTYEDLKDHRRAVIDAILNLREQPIAMENFGAQPTEPKSAALAEIADCDAFVGIYAHRYGWIPEGDTRSITEQEFDYARERGIRCFCYRVQKDFVWDAKFIETGAQADHLQQFLAKIGKLVTWKEFTTPDDFEKGCRRFSARTTRGLRAFLRASFDSCATARFHGTRTRIERFAGRPLPRPLS